MSSRPLDDPFCGWIETAEPPPAGTVLEGEHRVDCAVLGGGLAGLAAARRLCELRPDWRVAVIEAQRCGYGASGRSSGFVVDLAGFIAAMPEDHSERFVRLSRAGIAELRGLVERHGIECDWNESGFMHAAATEGGERSMDGLRRWLVKRGERFVDLDRAEIKVRTGTGFYRRAILLPGSVQVQTASLVNGLARHLPEQVTIFEDSKVRRIRQGSPNVLITERGRLAARHVIVTLNGYAPSVGQLRRRLFPLHTFGSLSRPLDDVQLRCLGTDRTWGILAQDPLGSTLRLTADRRLLVRNSLTYAPRFRIPRRRLDQARAAHRHALLLRYPEFEDLDFDFTWSGVMGASPNLYPFFGRVAPEIVATGGFSGAGIAMGTIGGKLLADLLVGEDSELLRDRLSLPGPRWIPPEPFLSPGIRLRLAWMISRAGGDV